MSKQHSLTRQDLWRDGRRGRFTVIFVVFFFLFVCFAPMPVYAGKISEGFEPDTPFPAVLSLGQLNQSELFTKNSDVILEIPGVARLMTLYMAVDRITTDELITVSPFAASRDSEERRESQLEMHTGDALPLRFMLLKMLFENSDAAAIAIAEKISGSAYAFVLEMQKTASLLGMDQTTFYTCDVARAERESDIPDEITAALAAVEEHANDENAQALVLPQASSTVRTAKTNLRDIARLVAALQNNPRSKAILSVSEDLVQITVGNIGQIIPMRSPAANLMTLSENRITAAYLLLSDRYSLLISIGSTRQGISLATIALSLRSLSMTQPTLRLYDSIDDYYTKSSLARAGDKYPGAPEKAANGELFDLVYLDSIDYVHPKTDPFLEQKLDYLGNAPYPLPIQKGVMTGQVVFTMKNGNKIPVRVGPDRDILANNDVVSRGILQLIQNPNLAYTIAGFAIVLCGGLLVLLIREIRRLRYWVRMKRMEVAQEGARAILFEERKSTQKQIPKQ
ncbi:MAG TPA: hypothetical protein VFD19_00095 [Clostridia bacterium]|nr:hypothetical protein [Clostridia bacterium]